MPRTSEARLPETRDKMKLPQRMSRSFKGLYQGLLYMGPVESRVFKVSTLATWRTGRLSRAMDLVSKASSRTG